ncbi:MAG: aspartate kinase [Clostridia bacterium]|nr:aspartate kinase [Clostridia bacterium]
MQLKVVKFGGSSLADAEHFKMVKEIVTAEEGRRYVIPSAPGKRFAEDTKVTDMLYKCYELAKKGENIESYFNLIKERYNLIIDGLGLDFDLSDEFVKIKNAFIHHAGKDYIASRGEYLSGLVLANYLGFDFIDASDVIYFTDNGSFDADRTNELLGEILKNHKYAVIPGFYGSMPNGTIKTFSRGGSDITGSIVARAAEADLYENWTDVSGFMMADPRIIKDPKPIDVVTYRELRELSYMGAGVLHEDSIFPVRFAGIPINIKNTNDRTAPGTMIVPETDVYDTDRVITGIAGKKGFSVISIEKDMMNAEVGFCRKVLGVLEELGICFEHLPSGIDTMCVIVNSADIAEYHDRLLNKICAAVNPDTISIEDGMALVAVVGRAMVKNHGTAAKVFRAVAKADVNIRMIDQGSSEFNIILGVNESDFETTLNAIYNEFVK